MPCPVCRSEFQIPKNGVADLPSRTQVNPSAMCEACSTDQQKVPATDYCNDCSQKLCANCGIPHKKIREGSHDVVPLESATPKLGARRYCEKHERERIQMYCYECNMNMCALCCLEDHKTHKFERIKEAVGQFAKLIDDDIDKIASRTECFHGITKHLEAENHNMLSNIKDMEQEVKKRSEETKRLVDRRESELLQELQSLKSATEKEINSRKDTVQSALSKMVDLMTRSSQLRSEGLPSDITQDAKDIHEEAQELLETHVIPSEYHAPSYKFTPVNIDELLRDDQNLIGHVVEDEDSGKILLLNRRNCTQFYTRI